MHRHIPKTRLSRLAIAAVAALGSGTLQAANVSWVGGGAGSFWDLMANWNTGLLPGATDDVLLGGFDTTLRSGTFTVQSYGGTGKLSITGGSLSNALASSIGSLVLSDGAIGGAGNLSIAGATTWTGGTMSGTGTTVANGMTISGNATKTLFGGRTLELNGTTTWSGNTADNFNAIRFWNGGTINNKGVFNDANAFASFIEHNVGGPHNFNNLGTYNKLSNTLTTVDLGVAFNNSGSVNVNAGTLRLNGGGTSSGAFNIDAGAKLQLYTGSFTLNNITTSGAGTFEIGDDFVGPDATVLLNGGTHTSRFVLSGSTLAGSSHTLQGPATWSAGDITGTAGQSTTFGNTLAITGASGKTLSGGRTVNAGNTTWSGNTANGNNAIAIAGGSAFTNTGSFTDANAFNSVMSRGNGGGAFVNNGVFNKQSNTTTTIGTAFNNNGTVNVDAGTLLMSSLDASTSNAGAYRIAAGAKLEFRNGPHTLNNVTTSGAGVFEISTENVGGDAFVAVNGGTHTTRFVFSGSTMGGSGATFQGPVTWSGGTISGAGTTTFSNNVDITGPNLKVLVGGRALDLQGTTTWSGNTAANNNAIRFWNGATINNSGTFNDANAFASFLEHNVGGPHAFNNSGTYNKLANTVTTVDQFVAFNNSGRINIDAGTMLFRSGTQGPSGTVRVAAGATYQQDAASTVGHMITAGNLALGASDADGARRLRQRQLRRRQRLQPARQRQHQRHRQPADRRGRRQPGPERRRHQRRQHRDADHHHRQRARRRQHLPLRHQATPAARARRCAARSRTAVNGGNITDARLSGSGVSAGNWGPIATGGSLSRDVVVTVGTAGVFAPIAGQAVSIVNNFDNTPKPAADHHARPPARPPTTWPRRGVAPSPVMLANQRVGGHGGTALTISNTAPAGCLHRRPERQLRRARRRGHDQRRQHQPAGRRRLERHGPARGRRHRQRRRQDRPVQLNFASGRQRQQRARRHDAGAADADRLRQRLPGRHRRAADPGAQLRHGAGRPVGQPGPGGAQRRQRPHRLRRGPERQLRQQQRHRRRADQRQRQLRRHRRRQQQQRDPWRHDRQRQHRRRRRGQRQHRRQLLHRRRSERRRQQPGHRRRQQRAVRRGRHDPGHGQHHQPGQPAGRQPVNLGAVRVGAASPSGGGQRQQRRRRATAGGAERVDRASRRPGHGQRQLRNAQPRRHQQQQPARRPEHRHRRQLHRRQRGQRDDQPSVRRQQRRQLRAQLPAHPGLANGRRARQGLRAGRGPAGNANLGLRHRARRRQRGGTQRRRQQHRRKHCAERHAAR